MGSGEEKTENSFAKKVAKKERQKIKAQSTKNKSVWSGLGMFGMIGWSVSVPALLGAVLGSWLDKKYPETFSWTLTCLIVGLFGGCLIAGHWVAKENKEMNDHKNDKND